MAFLDDVLEWLRNEEIVGNGFTKELCRWTRMHTDCKPTEVKGVDAWGSDFADGSTEGGFYGDTSVTITWLCNLDLTHETEIKPGDQMASLWDFMINKWKAYAKGE